ncbi:MAG: HIT domain-containing protein [Candidatus Kaelpia imicola]|nr:HIT domain-containing protein [Candidatus Kaelpia imicola]
MKNIWAPWRMEYVSNPDKDRDCIFCRKFKSRDDETNYVLSRGEHSFILLNIYPYNNGHLMVAPYRHVPDITDLNDSELSEIFKLIKSFKERLKKRLNPEGFNIGLNIGAAAGAGIKDHIHFHIVPRWVGDTNFMPLLSDTKVLSQSLNNLYQLLMSDE